MARLRGDMVSRRSQRRTISFWLQPRVWVRWGLLINAVAMVVGPNLATAAPCPVDHDHLAAALKASVKPSGGPTNGGLDNNEWAAVVDRSGVLRAIAFSGSKADDQWLGSRAIAAEKASQTYLKFFA